MSLVPRRSFFLNMSIALLAPVVWIWRATCQWSGLRIRGLGPMRSHHHCSEQRRIVTWCSISFSFLEFCARRNVSLRKKSNNMFYVDLALQMISCWKIGTPCHPRWRQTAHSCGLKVVKINRRSRKFSAMTPPKKVDKRHWRCRWQVTSNKWQVTNDKWHVKWFTCRQESVGSRPGKRQHW